MFQNVLEYWEFVVGYGARVVLWGVYVYLKTCLETHEHTIDSPHLPCLRRRRCHNDRPLEDVPNLHLFLRCHVDQ